MAIALCLVSATMCANRANLADDNYCFACGKANPIGLKLDFEKVNGEYVAEFTPLREHQGYAGLAHGGTIATVLDEAIARFAWAEGGKTVTAEITVRFRKPARTGEKLRVTGRLEEGSCRVIRGASEIRDENGVLLAEATAKLVRTQDE